jgi:hemolysin activation/secretion protein
MTRMNSKTPDKHCLPAKWFQFSHAHFLSWLLICLAQWVAMNLSAGESGAAQNSLASTTAPVATNAAPLFNVRVYAIEDELRIFTNSLSPIFEKYTGMNISLDKIVMAASDLQEEYRKHGFPGVSVAISEKQITNGIVTLNVFQGVQPQILVSGTRYLNSSNMVEAVTNPPPAGPAIVQTSPAKSVAATNAAPSAIRVSTMPANAEELAGARTALLQNMAEAAALEKDTRVHVVSTNAGPRFEVEKYLVMGNSALLPVVISEVLTNIDGAFGTNVSFDGIRTVVEELQRAYRERGYVTVAVGLPQQKLTNQTVKVEVTEGRLAVIKVTGNHYFSSNNVMRALPSLHTNMVLNGPIFQAELNRANANQDRQIYPVIGPGPDPGTSALTLKVKDQLPLHAKVDYDNESSPGTPDLRINTSAVYNNLWDLNQSLGVQYGFSPQQFKTGSQWPFYDEPLVANYGTFYSVPLGNPVPIEGLVANSPGNFGYDEATHKFNLPAPTGQPELTVFASRSTIDTGIENLGSQNLSTNSISVVQYNTQQSLTVNQDVGGRVNFPFVTPASVQLNLSGGLDFKTYQVSNYKTNSFLYVYTNYDSAGNPILPPVTSTVESPVPATTQQVQYLPLAFGVNSSWRDSLGNTTLGLGVSYNPWFTSQTYVTKTSTDTNNVTTTTTKKTSGQESLEGITGSPNSTGNWVVLNPTFTRTFIFHTNWVTTFRGDGQWASQPLISNEQFGIGGVNSVRGYHEGEEFGDTGWHFSLEQATPPHQVGMVFDNTPLTLRGSVYMDIATVYLLDPLGRPAATELWGTGFGFTASVGSHWDARFLFSLPLIGTSTTPQDQPYFNFILTAQF